MDEVQDVLFRSELTMKAEKVWNNNKICDCEFLLKNSKFHVSSHLIYMSSSILYSQVETHHEHCDDKILTMPGLMFDESFEIILKYMHGMELNFSRMQKPIICEVLRLCETYELSDIFTAIKSFLSTLDNFELDSFFVLINTAKKFLLNDLYKKLIIYAYENSEQVLKHESFKDLQYEVLSELLKSNLFYAPEIDILRSALLWHSENLNQCPRRALEMLDEKISSAYVAEESADGCDSQSHAARSEKVFTSDSKSCDKKVITKFKKMALNQSAGPSSGDSNENNPDVDNIITDQLDSCAELAKTFSENVLKKLLSYIRVKNISAFEYMTAFKTELFLKHRVFLEEDKYFSKSLEPRNKFKAETRDQTERNDENSVNVKTGNPNRAEINNQNEGIVNNPTVVEPRKKLFTHVINKFTIKIPEIFYFALHESEEECLLGDTKWKACMMDDGDNLHMYLKYVSTTQRDWECTVECQFKFVSQRGGFDSWVVPRDGSYRRVTLTPAAPCVEVCECCWRVPVYGSGVQRAWWQEVYRLYQSDAWVFTVEVHFKSIEIETK